MIIHTTPSPRVQETLFKMGARAEQTATRHFFPAGLASRVYGRSWWPSLPADKRVVTDPTPVSYPHLDVYKRQPYAPAASIRASTDPVKDERPIKSEDN